MTTKINPKDISFAIIHHRNSPNDAVTLDGYTVKRSESLYIPEWRRSVMCAPYDNHFIYADPTKKRGRWAHMCTCGAPAVIVGAQAYAGDASPTRTGELLVCYSHANTGKHSDGST